jgi:hypothetical protein
VPPVAQPTIEVAAALMTAVLNVRRSMARSLSQ